MEDGNRDLTAESAKNSEIKRAYTFFDYRECKKETNPKMWFYWGF
jgi:hypothetical protein